MTKAEIVCDSISPDGVRLTTFVVVFHRFVLAEMNTHRVFSRNSASSRAIPIEKMLTRVADDPALPISWGSNKPGMQAGDELPSAAIEWCQQQWEYAAYQARAVAHDLNAAGLHKQVANRLLEPFMWHTAVITAVDFDNFFWQRCHPDAQPEMKAAADAMQLAYYRSEPDQVSIGQWHLPFINGSDIETIALALQNNDDTASTLTSRVLETLKQVCTARCARVSYLQHDGTRSWQKDVELFERLSVGLHPSPFEHAATPCTHAEQIAYRNAILIDDDVPLHFSCKLTGNFARGWHQYRKFFEWENRTNFIPNHPELI